MERPRGEERPQPRTFEELVLPALDGSGSMKEKERRTGRVKADAVIDHLLGAEDGLVPRLKVSRNRDRYYVGLVTYDERVNAVPPKALAQLAPDDLVVDLTVRHGGSTAIGRALAEAGTMARQWLAQADPGVPRYATIMLMSDGQETCGSDPVGVAANIKAGAKEIDGRPEIVIATAAYGDDDDCDEAALREMASPRPDGAPFFARVETGQELREFFLASMRSSVV